MNSLSFGEVAALLYSVKKVTREMQSINKVKIPHMLKENMKLIVCDVSDTEKMKDVKKFLQSKSVISLAFF